MKKIKKLLIIALSVCTILSVTSCATKQKEFRERDETFIADINLFEIGKLHLYTNVNFSKPKISDFTVTFAPRTNYVIIKGRIGIDVVRIGFSYPERKSLFEAKEKYLADYENGTIPDVKPKKKNAYSTGDVFIEWGVAGAAREADTTYMTNAQYIEKDKPYFRIFFDSVPDPESKDVYSPRVSIYISPSQWESIMELCNQAHLEELTDEILAEAEAF